MSVYKAVLKGIKVRDIKCHPTLDKHCMDELTDGIGLGDDVSRSKDILGRVYEYFIGRFAAAEGKDSGEFYTSQCVAKLLVRRFEPYKGHILTRAAGPAAGRVAEIVT